MLSNELVKSSRVVLLPLLRIKVEGRISIPNLAGGYRGAWIHSVLLLRHSCSESLFMSGNAEIHLKDVTWYEDRRCPEWRKTLPSIWMRNSGMHVLQNIWLPSDHLSLWIMKRCCFYHASSSFLFLSFKEMSIWISGLEVVQIQVSKWRYYCGKAKKLNPSVSERKKKIERNVACLRHRGAPFWCTMFCSGLLS